MVSLWISFIWTVPAVQPQTSASFPPGLIANIQVSDRTPSQPGTPHRLFTGRKLPGEGQIPLRELITAALENSPKATIDLEVLNEELRSLPMDEAAARLAAAGKAWVASL